MKRTPTPLTAPTPLRRRAETRLRELSGKNHYVAGAARSPADTQRLLHELQVHQIELEMQNEELKKARDEMEAGLEKYSELYDFAPMGYFTLAADGRILLVNLTGASLLGLERSRLVGQLLGPQVLADHRPDFDNFLQRTFAGETKQSCEVSLARPGSPPRTVNIEAQRLPFQQGCRAVMRDVTARRQAEEQVRISEIRYRRLFEAAHDGVLLLDPHTCKITEANPFMTKLLGYPRNQLVGKELFEIGLLKDKAASREMFQNLTRDHEVRYEDLPLESQKGRHQEVEVVASLYQEDGHSVIQCNIRDITERKAAETALRQSEERYRSLFNSIDEGFCVIEMIFDKKGKPADYRFLAVNPAFEKQTGISNAVGRRAREIAPQLESYWFETYGRVALTGEPVRFTNEAKPLHRWFDVYAFRLDGKGSRKIAVLLRNITVKRQVEEALREAQLKLTHYAGKLETLVARRTAELTVTNVRLRKAVVSVGKSKNQYQELFLESQILQKKLRLLTHQILTAQEEERKAISRELHDVVVQTLVGINVELSALGQAAEPGLKGKIAHTRRLVEETVDTVHRFARELRPAVLDDLGLIPALHAYCKNLAAREKLKIKLTAFGGVEAMDDTRRTVLFRVAQEALTNVVRHAHATGVKIGITRIPGAIRMEICDDGKSFQVRKTLRTKTNKRLGLVGMRERIEMVGGNLTLESTPGQGTTVQVEIPFNPEKSIS